MKLLSVILRTASMALLFYPAQTTTLEIDIGTTDEDGCVSTQNRALFPSLYSLPPIEFRDQNNVDLGTLQIGLTVDIVLSDGVRKQTYLRVIRNGSNSFDLTWDPE